MIGLPLEVALAVTPGRTPGPTVLIAKALRVYVVPSRIEGATSSPEVAVVLVGLPLSAKFVKVVFHPVEALVTTSDATEGVVEPGVPSPCGKYLYRVAFVPPVSFTIIPVSLG